jgi:putative ABC transport system permease protein
VQSSADDESPASDHRVRSRERTLPLPGIACENECDPRRSFGQSGAGSGWQRQANCPALFRDDRHPACVGPEFYITDTTNSPKVTIISENVARKHFPNQNPLGKILPNEVAAGFGGVSIEFVGVAKDIKERLRSERWAENIYVPYMQVPSQRLGQVNFFVRVAGNPKSIIPALRRETLAGEQDLAFEFIKTQAEETNQWVVEERSLATLLSFFGALALGLASLGLYGMISYTAMQCTREISLCMVLGAQPRDVQMLVVGHGTLLAGVGVALGLAGAVAVTHVIKSSLFGVSATDLLTFTGSAVLSLLVTLLACYLPARRATLVDPSITLRQE